MRAYYFTIIYIYLYIYNSNFLLTHKIVFVILSYCHNCHTNACMPQGEIHSSCLQNPAISIRKNTFRFLQKIVSRPPEASKKKSFPV